MKQRGTWWGRLLDRTVIVAAVSVLLLLGSWWAWREWWSNDMLGQAAKEGNNSRFNALLRFHAVVDTPDGAAEPLLHFVAHVGSQEMMRSLLAAGAQLDQHDSRGRTALMRAVAAGRVDMCRLLIGKGATCTPQMLWKSLSLPDMNLARLLLDNGVSVDAKNAKGQTALHQAVMSGRPEWVSLILEYQPTLDERYGSGNTSLHLAVEATEEEIVDQLLAAGSDSNLLDGGGSPPAFKILFSGGEVWRYSLNESERKILERLIEAGANVNFRHQLGLTPLLVAVGLQEERAVEILVQNGADPNLRGDGGSTPLHRVAEVKNRRIAKILIEAGGDIEVKNDGGETPVKMWPVLGAILREVKSKP